MIFPASTRRELNVYVSRIGLHVTHRALEDGGDQETKGRVSWQTWSTLVILDRFCSYNLIKINF